METILFIASLFGGIAIGLPIAYAILGSAVLVMLGMGEFDIQAVVQSSIAGVDSFVLLAVPFFILAGELMNAGGLSQRIVEMAMAFVGHLRGGMGYVAVIAAVILASLSGSAVADTAALGSILIPMMRQAGYGLERSCGLIASGGIIAPIIPPSIGFLLYGVVGNVSITKLFLAGVFPGLLMGAALLVVWSWLSRTERGKVRERLSWRARLQALAEGGWALLMPVIIIGGLKFGVFTPTESAVVAVFYALFVGVFIYRELNARKIYHALLAATKTTSVVLILVATSAVASYVITISEIPAQITAILHPFMENPTALVALMLLVTFFLGMALEFIPVILILAPVFLPIIAQGGIDPVYFGVVFMMTVSVGMLMPPVGVVLNVISAIGKLPLERAVAGVLPFMVAEIVLVILMILFPALVMVPLRFLA
ncbi:MAG: TRAP transporter large permease subunit [Rhodocyclales bacterium]|nr:TRAP transporter large permease subunit [Rhodocyclales bacterium]